jgi:hypothetical protein
MDGIVYAQPLYLSNVTTGGGTHNVVYVATEHDSVYAIDADTGRIYWQKSLIPSGGSTVSSGTDLSCGDISTEVGITGTPVIDSTTGTLYVVAKVKLNGAIQQHLHALDVSTGAEKFGGPNTIQASVAGTAADGDGSMVTFDPRQENQRSALLLENGHVVVGWTAHCDKSPWHGWVMSYGATTLTLEGTYNASANGYGNGIWMSGGGMAADTSGNIYFATGNGSWNATDLGNSIVKLGPPTASKLPVVDYFTPYNQGALTSVDYDLSSGGLILLPTLANGKQLLTMIGKEGKIYLVDRNNMGKYCITQTPKCTNSNPQIVQEIAGAFTGLWDVPAYWNGHLYWSGGNDYTGAAEALKSYSFNANNSGLISTAPTTVTARTFGFSGPVPSVSANGTSNAIVWGLDNSRQRTPTCVGYTNCQVLYAYDATNLGTLLYHSSQAANYRDVPGGPVKFSTPTIANGKVYVGSLAGVSAYGLLNAGPPTATAPTLSPGGGSYTSPVAVTIADATPNSVIYYTTNGSTPTTASAKYSGALTLGTTTTVKALAAASGYMNSAVSTATYTITTSSSTVSPVSLTAAYNVYGIDKDGSAYTNGGLDTSGYTLSGTLLGSAVSWSGITFNLGSAGAANGVSSSTIALPTGNYTTLNLLAVGVNGNQGEQPFVVTYTDGSTTTITQSISDWFTPQNYPGESRAVTMSYVLTPTGTKRAGQYYVYGYSFAINSAKTVKSVALPANRNVVVLAAALSGATGTTPPPAGPKPVSLTAVANVYAINNNGVAITNGGLDGFNYSLSSAFVGSTVIWSGVTFNLGAAGTANAVDNATITLPAGNYATLNLLAAGVNGNQPAQKFVVTYTDGTTTTITQSVSDWFTPQNYAGESRAVTMSYVLTPTGTQRAGQYYVYGYSLAINSAKTVKSVALPVNRNVVVLAATLSGATTAGGATIVSLGTVANIYGMFNDGSPVTNGGMDTFGNAYSKTLLGASLTWSGATFTLGGAGVADAVYGATIPLPAGNFSTLKLLATGIKGNHLNQIFTVTYTDGTTTAITQSLSGWLTPQNYAGESIASTMAYRVIASGAKGTGSFYLFGYSFAINGAKTVKSVTLPNTRDVVVLAADLLP